MSKTTYTGAVPVNQSVLDGARPTIWSFVRQQDANRVPVNIADGASYPLSGYYATLAAAQVDYPHAVALTDELAWAAIQAGLNAQASNGGGGFLIPPGSYVLSTGISIASSVTLLGSGRDATTLTYTASSGDAITMNGGVAGLYCGRISGISLTCNQSPNTARGVYAYHVHQSEIDIHVDSFSTNVHVSGNDSAEYSEDVWIRAFDSRLQRASGLTVDHTIGLHLVGHSVIRTAVDNPLGAWGAIFDTGTSGIYTDQVDLEYCGWKIRNTMPTTGAMGRPPEFFFLSQVVADTAPTAGILLDATLATADALGRKGKSYHFVNCWAAFTQTDGKSGVEVRGGEDISFTGCRFRLNKLHGLYATNCADLRILNCAILGNNQQDSASGHGIRIDSGVGAFSIIGGVCGNAIAGEVGHQRYGASIDSSITSQFVIQGVDLRENETGPIDDASASGFRTVFGNATGATYAPNRIHGAAERIELGDGNNYLDYKHDEADSVAWVMDAGDYMRYTRTTNAWYWVLNNVALMTLVQTGVLTFDVAVKIGIGVAPSARLTLPTGTTSAGTAPLKLTAGINLTTPEAGAIEYDGTDLWFTNGASRRKVQFGSADYSGTGSPEGAISASVGKLYLQSDGTGNTVLWTKAISNIAGDTTQGWLNRGQVFSDFRVYSADKSHYMDIGAEGIVGSESIALTPGSGGFVDLENHVRFNSFTASRPLRLGATKLVETGLVDLSDTTNAVSCTTPATTRTLLGLGGAAVCAVGTGAGDVAAGNHTHTSLSITDLGTTIDAQITSALSVALADFYTKSEADARFAPI